MQLTVIMMAVVTAQGLALLHHSLKPTKPRILSQVPTSDQLRVTPAGRSTLTRHTLGDEAEEVKPDEKGVPEIEKVVKKFKKREPVEKKLTHLTNSEELSKSSEKLNMKEENRNRA